MLLLAEVLFEVEHGDQRLVFDIFLPEGFAGMEDLAQIDQTDVEVG